MLRCPVIYLQQPLIAVYNLAIAKKLPLFGGERAPLAVGFGKIKP
jgi:hypothetical protein